MRQVTLGTRSGRPTGLRRLNVAAEQKAEWLRIYLRLLSVGYLVGFVPWIVLILVKAPILTEGGRLAPLLRFQPYNADYESMLVAIHIVWAVMLWRASSNPPQHGLFLDFTIWATVAHGIVMLVATPIQKGPVMFVIEALPLFAIAGVLWWLRAEGTVGDRQTIPKLHERA